MNKNRILLLFISSGIPIFFSSQDEYRKPLLSVRTEESISWYLVGRNIDAKEEITETINETKTVCVYFFATISFMKDIKFLARLFRHLPFFFLTELSAFSLSIVHFFLISSIKHYTNFFPSKLFDALNFVFLLYKKKLL